MNLPRAAICAIAIVAVLTMAGCSFEPDPPADLKQQAADLARSVEALPGIRSAKATVRDVDSKDKPGEWYVELDTTGSSPADIDTLPQLLGPIVNATEPDGRPIQLILRIPGGPGIAPTMLGHVADGTVQTAKLVRTTSGVLSVSGVGYGLGLYVSTDSSVALPALMPTLREAMRQGDDVVPAVTASWNERAANQLTVDVTPEWPSDELADTLVRLHHLSESTYLYTSAGEGALQSVTVHVTSSADFTEASTLLSAVTDGGGTSATLFWLYGPGELSLHGTI